LTPDRHGQARSKRLRSTDAAAAGETLRASALNAHDKRWLPQKSAEIEAERETSTICPDCAEYLVRLGQSVSRPRADTLPPRPRRRSGRTLEQRERPFAVDIRVVRDDDERTNRENGAITVSPDPL